MSPKFAKMIAEMKSYLKNQPLEERVFARNYLTREMHKLNIFPEDPINCVEWIRYDMIHVPEHLKAGTELVNKKLMTIELRETGLTSPISVEDKLDHFEIIDQQGADIYTAILDDNGLLNRLNGYLPIIKLKKQEMTSLKKFFVSKSDVSRANFIRKSIDRIKPDSVYIICDKDRQHVYEGIEATTLPLRDLNKAANWIRFKNEFSKKSLLVIDQVLKFVFFGDGKKKYLKDMSQSFNYVIVTDVVPFYSDPAEIFYPFWFLGKEILGYNNYNSFAANHAEEKEDGTIDQSHSFDVLKEKIKDYYVQDYKRFFVDREYVEWEMTEEDIERYEAKKKEEADNFTNPIKLYNTCSTVINLIETKFKVIDRITRDLKNTCIAINALGPYPGMFKKHMANKSIDFLSIHGNPADYDKYDTVILAEMPIVKPHDWIYIEPRLEGKRVIQLSLTNNKLEVHFHNKIFNNQLRNEFDAHFYNADMLWT